MKKTEELGNISTGNGELDKKLGGGIPTGSLTLVEGWPDSGKSVLCQQIMWGSLAAGHRATMYTNENSIRSLLSQMNSLNQDISDYYLLGRLKIQPMKTVKTSDDPAKALDNLLLAMAREEDLVIIDSLTSYLTRATSEQSISFFENCKCLCDRKRSILGAVHSYAFNESILARITSMCDAHLKLRIEAMGDQLIKMLEVSKVRGAERNTGNIISFDVEPGCGIRIIPYSKVKA